MPVLSLACHLPHNTPHIPSRYNNEQTTKQTKAINNSYIYINISCKCDTNCAGHFTLDAYASRPVACLLLLPAGISGQIDANLILETGPRNPASQGKVEAALMNQASMAEFNLSQPLWCWVHLATHENLFCISLISKHRCMRVKSLIVEDKNLVILQCQYQDCWWPGDKGAKASAAMTLA